MARRLARKGGHQFKERVFHILRNEWFRARSGRRGNTRVASER
jgi:hypothetical protein